MQPPPRHKWHVTTGPSENSLGKGSSCFNLTGEKAPFFSHDWSPLGVHTLVKKMERGQRNNNKQGDGYRARKADEFTVQMKCPAAMAR